MIVGMLGNIAVQTNSCFAVSWPLTDPIQLSRRRFFVGETGMKLTPVHLDHFLMGHCFAKQHPV